MITLNFIEFIVVFVVFVVAIAIMFPLGIWYGKISERENWYKLLCREVKRKESLRWTATININYPSMRADAEPNIRVAIGSTKKSTNSS